MCLKNPIACGTGMSVRHTEMLLSTKPLTVTPCLPLSTEKFDIVPILAQVETDGTIGGGTRIELLKWLSNAGAKLIVFASENTVESYIAAFPAKKRTGFFEPNLVLTLERKGNNFPRFFSALLGLMAKGRTMPMAWVKLVPQDGDSRRMKELPETIFEANLGQTQFVP